MKHIFLTFLIALAATGVATAQTKQRYELKVNDFKELRVDNHIAVDYYCNADSAGYAVFDATDAQAGWIIFDNNGRGKALDTERYRLPERRTDAANQGVFIIVREGDEQRRFIGQGVQSAYNRQVQGHTDR